MKTPLEMLYYWEKNASTRVHLRQPVAGTWHEYSFERCANEIRRAASALKALNLPSGSHIAIASKNCAHWVLSDLAIWMAGHVSIPLYPNLAAQTVRTILEHSESKALFLGKLDNYGPYLEGIPKGMPVYTFPYGAPSGYPGWNDLIQKHAPMTESPARELDDLATIIYTSGTTGVPKGVMHRFRSFSYAATHILEEIDVAPEDKFFSYLPLAHVAERLLTETVGLYAGASLTFVESLDLFAENLEQTQPTIFLGVPRIWEKFKVGIEKKLPEKKLKLLLSLPIVSGLIRKKIKRSLGLSQAKICISGAAAIPKSLIEWFGQLGITIQEAYGLTENFAYSHFNFPGRVRVGTVGQPWPGVEVEIGENEEILIKSDCLMQGYFKAPEQTREVIVNGFLKTGDQGAVDAQGYLKITGRVKELFKTAKGKYVAPTPIELRLASLSLLDQVCVLGSGMPAPIALVTLSESGKGTEKINLTSSLQAHVTALNTSLDPHERLAKVVVLKESWTVENEFLTPTMKLKRNKVEAKYAEQLPAWVNSKETVVFV